MKDAACRPDELTTAMVLRGVGMGLLAGRSICGYWTGEKPVLARGERSVYEVQGRCLSLFAVFGAVVGGGSCDALGCGLGLIANADRGAAEGILCLFSLDGRSFPTNGFELGKYQRGLDASCRSRCSKEERVKY